MSLPDLSRRTYEEWYAAITQNSLWIIETHSSEFQTLYLLNNRQVYAIGSGNIGGHARLSTNYPTLVMENALSIQPTAYAWIQISPQGEAFSHASFLGGFAKAGTHGMLPWKALISSQGQVMRDEAGQICRILYSGSQDPGGPSSH